MCHHHKYDKDIFKKMIIHSDGRDIQAWEINILTTVLSLFALHYLGISGDLTEVLPAPRNTQSAELLEHTPPWYQRKYPCWRSWHFPSHLWVNEKACIQRYLCLSGSTVRHLWYWFILVAGTCQIKAHENGRKKPDAELIQGKNWNLGHFISLFS